MGEMRAVDGPSGNTQFVRPGLDARIILTLIIDKVMCGIDSTG
jgi:hypothetical protein